MARSTEITNDADVIDSRDVIARIRHLESERDDTPEDTDWATEYPEEALPRHHSNPQEVTP